MGEDETGDARAKAQEVAGQAQEQAQAAAGQAQAKLREQLDQRSSQLAEQISQQTSDLRSVSEALREQGKDSPAQAADRLAGYAEKVGGYLRETKADAMLGDAEDFGRRQPATVAAGALALGFAASRFLKASSSRRYSARNNPQGTSPDSTPRAPAVHERSVPPPLDSTVTEPARAPMSSASAGVPPARTRS